MKALRYGLRGGLGVLLLASMFVVPMLAAQGGGPSPLSVDHDPSDGPDPVTVNFDASFDVIARNFSESSENVTVFATTNGQGFVTWYSQDKWFCEPVSSDAPLQRGQIFHAADLQHADQIECTTIADIPAGGQRHLHLVAQAPSDPGSLGIEVSAFKTSASDSVDVEAKTGDDAIGFIPADGGKIKTDGKPDAQDDTNSVIKTLNGAGPGGVFELHDLAPGDPGYEDICGNGNCDGKVIEVEIPDGYTHRQNPPKLKLVYDETAAGAGEDATIWIKKANADPEIVPECDVDGVAKPHPCHGPAHVKRNGDVRYIVYLLSGDPLCGKH